MAAITPGKPSRQTSARDAWPVASPAADTYARVPAAVLAETESISRQRWREHRESGRIKNGWRVVRRMIFRRIHRLNAPIVYPWFVSAHADGIEHELHRAAADLVRSRARGFWARSWHRCKIATWPMVAALAVPVSLAHYGPQVRRRFGLGWGTQLRDLWRGAFRHGIFPTEFFHRRVFCEPTRSAMAGFFGEREMIELTRAAARGENTARVTDVLRFFSECRAAGFSVPRTAVFFRHGELEFRATEGPALLPEKDLMVQVIEEHGDQRGERWHWNSLSRQWNCRGESSGARALFERWRRKSHSASLLVQTALNNHPEMARFSAGGLVEIRIATLREEDGGVVPLSAAMHMPSSPAEGSTATHGFLAAAINLPSGTLHRAVGEFISDGEFDLHPETGAVITGTVVPRWPELLDLVQRAHGQFDGISYLRWRIGLAGNGPVILGADSEWEVFSLVSPSATRWAASCLRCLKTGVERSVASASGVSTAVPRPA